MTNEITQEAKKAQKESSLWTYLGWTLPFTALAVLVFEWYFNAETLYSYTIIVITVVFFTISVFWWWWAVNKFSILMDSMKRTEDNFVEVKDSLKEIKKEIKEIDDSIR